MSQLARLLLATLSMGLVASNAAADISVRLSNEALTDGSEAIVIGRVTAAESRWVNRSLVTAVMVQISETLKGGLAGQIEVLLPGGIDASRRFKVAMTYPGAPQMQTGEEVFLFLVQDDDLGGGYVVAGFAQGKFSILTQQGTQVVSRDLRGSQLVEGTGISRGTVVLMPLADFRNEIAGYVSR
jgi:hypothetical protein